MKTLRIFALTLGLALVGAASAITNPGQKLDALAPAPLANQVVSTAPTPTEASVTGATNTSPAAMILPVVAVLVVFASGPLVRRAFRI